MTLELSLELLDQIHAHSESTYPEEATGLLLGIHNRNSRRVTAILSLSNAREASARHNRYLITPQDMLHGEREAERQGLSVLGIYHSHPDHPARPSDFDRQWALPWFFYLITSVQSGQAKTSRAWRLADDRSGFFEEPIRLTSNTNEMKLRIK